MIKEKNFKYASFSSDFTHIIDSYGNEIEWDDPRIIHIWPFTGNAAPIIKEIFEKKGWRIRFCKPVTSEILHQAKKLCSGRECLSFNSLVGLYYDDIIKNHNEEEVAIYWGVEQEGPCQCADWPDILKLFISRLNLKNVIFSVNLTIKNNSLGQGDKFGANVLIATILGDLFDEAEAALRCLAVDYDEALKTFHKENAKVISCVHGGIKSIELALKEWSDSVSKIPLKISIDKAPKVLVFGGAIMGFLSEPLVEYYTQQGIIPKIVDGHEFSLLLVSEFVRRHGFKRGYDTFKEQMNIGKILISYLNLKQDKKEIGLAFKACLALKSADSAIQRFRKACQTSGIIFDKHVSFESILEEGHKLLNANTFYEADVAVGRYLNSIENEVFDGLVHIAVFNCQPSINAQTLIGGLSHKYDIPYAGLELDGPWLSNIHRRLMENVAVQAKRLRKQKNDMN